MDESAAVTLTLESPTLSCQNSAATSVVVPKKLTVSDTPLHRSSFHEASSNQNQKGIITTTKSLLDLEVLSIKSSSFSSSYTSLKDVLPSASAAINSPTASSAAIFNSSYDISIRNRLVKQAAWAYLQPMSSSPSTTSAPAFLSRLCHRFSSVLRRSPLTDCLNFIFHHLVPAFTRILHQILHAFRAQVSTSMLCPQSTAAKSNPQ